MAEEKNKYSAPAAEKVLDIIELMAQRSQSFTVTEIANTLEISTNSVFRIMRELESKHYVIKNPTDSSYELTSKLYYLGNLTKSRISIIKESQNTMKYILNRTQETVLLAQLDENYRTLVIDQMESPLPIKFLSMVGHSYDSYTSAMGKCLLAYCSDSELNRYLYTTKLVPQTSHTITDPQILKQEIMRIRQFGIAYDDEESVTGLCCLACPILSAQGKLEGSLGISMVNFRINSKIKQEYAKILKEQCDLLSSQLCYKKKAYSSLNNF